MKKLLCSINFLPEKSLKKQQLLLEIEQIKLILTLSIASLVVTIGLLSSFITYHYFSYSSIAPNLIAEYKIAVELDKKIDKWEYVLKKAADEENNIVYAVDKISKIKNQDVAFKSLVVNDKGEISIEAVSKNESIFGYLAEQLSNNDEQLFLNVKVDKIGTNNVTGEKNSTIIARVNPRAVVK